MKQQTSLLKEQQLSQSLLSKNKKTNALVQNHYIKSKIGNQRNKLSNFLHDFQAGYMQPQNDKDQTLKVTQHQIKDSVNVQTAANIFDLNLSMGKYSCNYSRNGSTLMLTSSQGQLSLIKWRQKQQMLDINLKQQIIAATFLHSDQMMALCQKNNLFIYDSRGIQIHKLNKALGVQFLPYHFLLAAYDQYKLKYYDMTTGHVIADHIAKNPYTTIRQNRSNGVIALGSQKGVVEWWTPSIGTPAVKMFAGSAINDIGFYKGYMYTVSQNLKVWDSRMLKTLHEYPLHRKIKNIQVSQSGLLSLNYGFKLEIFKDMHQQRQTHPYMIYPSKNKHVSIDNGRFVPFEDIMGLGTAQGFSSIVVPGSGVPFYDTFQVNPFQTKKQKREKLVHQLMEKLPPETILIDPNVIGNIDKTSKEVLMKQQNEEKQAKEKLAKQNKKKKNKRSSISKKLNSKNIQFDKKRRLELTNTINTKLWTKWAEKKKKESELEIVQSMADEGINVTQLPKKIKKIRKQSD